ncbi:alpha/beta hydrolase family protein [Thalassomonas sp. M1454]|uniref:alpha/beta hydrolase family protein n=1 Tax=Thalassomonas sp. M1454 TaxID=2594477 RepID=UPI00117D5FF1|nr:prolyl oligopeptidase family serine peptidase [Thalassomonas sp. M1454]TRX53919.1 S9 family peptidase [Thalassomonas sp. M1454]
MFKNLALYFFIFFISCNAHANKWDKLFDRPEYLSVKISPDGEHLAVKVMKDGKPALVFLNTETMNVTGSSIFPGKNEVGYYKWINNERVVIQVNQREPWNKESFYYGELFAVNMDGSKGKLIYGYRAGEKQVGSNIKKNKQIIGWAHIIDTLPDDDEHIIISSTPQSKHSNVIASILKINIYNGRIKEKLGRAPAVNANIITDVNGQIRAATAIDKNQVLRAYLKKDNEWQTIPQENFGSSFTPITINSSGDQLYTLDNYNQDFTGLFKLNLNTGEYKHILTDKNVDISDAIKSTDGRTVYAVRADDGFPVYYMINKSLPEAKVFKNLVATYPGHSIDITSHTKDGKSYIVKVSSDIEPGNFYIYDTEKNSIALLFKYYPKLDSKHLVYTDPFKFTASDGLEVNGFFTQGKVAKKGDIAPLVIYVHGGPHIKDSWGFDPNNQYLANNGYSVLQVNFRGSTGYGANFESAGYKNWGTKIQRDIREAFDWAVANGKAKKDKACIMGGSFGGYSAVQSTIIYPDAYKCAISYAGVFDLPLMFDEGNIKNVYYGKSYLENTVGKDESTLKAMSPVYNTEKMKTPLLLAHGRNDKQVPFEHSQRLLNAMSKTGNDYIWYPVDSETHGLFDPENKKQYMNNVLKFLNKHLM